MSWLQRGLIGRVVAAIGPPPAVDATRAARAKRPSMPMRLWCEATPNHPPRVVDVMRRAEYPNFRADLLEMAALQAVESSDD